LEIILGEFLRHGKAERSSEAERRIASGGGTREGHLDESVRD
jgi:hypothetical protein